MRDRDQEDQYVNLHASQRCELHAFARPTQPDTRVCARMKLCVSRSMHRRDFCIAVLQRAAMHCGRAGSRSVAWCIAATSRNDDCPLAHICSDGAASLRRPCATGAAASPCNAANARRAAA